MKTNKSFVIHFCVVVLNFLNGDIAFRKICIYFYAKEGILYKIKMRKMSVLSLKAEIFFFISIPIYVYMHIYSSRVLASLEKAKILFFVLK